MARFYLEKGRKASRLEYNFAMNRISLLLLVILSLLQSDILAETGASLAASYSNEVTLRLQVPRQEQLRYAQLLKAALVNAGKTLQRSQYIVVLDRNPQVQAVFLYWLDNETRKASPHFIGASPASTGKPGEFDYFITPLGVFDHTLANPDFRAEGTPNKLGIRGFGAKGVRVFDFGWVLGTRGWGSGGTSQMRLLMHATDPEHLEHHLGEPRSRGCIRIPESLIAFIDRYGLLDADYEQALASGQQPWVLRPDRTPTPWSGRYLVIVDSARNNRPDWSPQPAE